MLIRPPVLILVVLFLVIACSSTSPSSLGEPRNNPRFLDPPLRLSTGAWLLLLASFSGVSISFRIFLFHSSFQSLCGVIIGPPSTLSRIPSSMNEPNIWTSIAIWFVRNLTLVCFGPTLFLLLLSWPIFLPSPSPLLHLIVWFPSWTWLMFLLPLQLEGDEGLSRAVRYFFLLVTCPYSRLFHICFTYYVFFLLVV